MGNYLYNNEHDVMFTRPSRIRSFRKSPFGPFTLKCNPRVFKLIRGLQCFQKSPFSRVENAGRV